MFQYIINTLKQLLKSPTVHHSLDQYITSHNPQTAEDVDRLEREFYRKNTQIHNYHHFHE